MRTPRLSFSGAMLTSGILCALTLLNPTAAPGQDYAKHPYPDVPGLVRKDDPAAPCNFAPEFQRISDNKSDPRVAYIEIEPLVNHPDRPTPFRQLCKNVAAQSEDVKAAVFDKPHGFLQIIYGEEAFNTAVAYFAGEKGSPGVILYVNRLDDSEFHSFVFTYQNDQWHNRTAEYLGPLHLTDNDYLVVPQYGRTARIMTLAADQSGFHHKQWLRWTGVKFELQTIRPKDWRCPDSYRYFEPTERRKFCQ